MNRPSRIDFESPGAAGTYNGPMGRVVRIRFGAIAVAIAALVVACGSSIDAGPTPSPSAASPVETPSTSPSATSPGVSPSPATVTYEVSSCPVFDDAFCGTAVEVIDALQDGDAGRLFELSRSSRLECAELARQYFPDCEAPDDVLRGYGLSGPTFIVEVAGPQEYRQRLDAVVASIDPAFTDELGDGRVRVVGVGTCGPDIPGRRTYHLAWTAAVSDESDAAKRFLGSFELIFDEDWRIGLWYVGPLTDWEREQPPDPLQNAFCEAGRSTWPT